MSPASLKPPALGRHPVVGVIAPASSAQQARLDAGAQALRTRGWQLRFLPHAESRTAPYFSAGAAERLEDLHAAFCDPTIDMIVCTRGGYGSNYLLPLLDLDLIGGHPKPLLGYSDMTALQSYLLDATGLVAFHAPMLAADFYRVDGVDWPSFEAVLGGDTYVYGAQHGLRTLQAGTAEGALVGGCLTLLTSLLGTPFAPALGHASEPTLLFVEDVGTKPYQVDRMLRQLMLAGRLHRVTGIIFGEMQDGSSPGAAPGLLEQAILHALSDFRGPIAFGLRSGHVSRANVTLPLGIRAQLRLAEPELDGQGAQLTLLEPATIAASALATGPAAKPPAGVRS